MLGTAIFEVTIDLFPCNHDEWQQGKKEPIYISSFIRTDLPTVLIFGDQESSHIFIFPLQINFSLVTFYCGPLVMF